MAAKRRRALGLAIALSVVGVAAIVASAFRGEDTRHAKADAQRWARFPTEATPESSALPAPNSPADVDKRAKDALADWRTAILARDAEMLTRLDMAFLDAPSMYLDGLKTSAGTDDNERVRAFSTHELGKLKRVDLAPTFKQLLDDKNPYVRKNAAWALGELSAGNDGRAAARIAQAHLRKVMKQDPEEDVRAAARTALERID